MLQVPDSNETPANDNPNVSSVVKENIRTVLLHRRENLRKRTLQDRIGLALTNFSGTMAFVYIHTIWFGAWVLLNTGRFGIKPFDPFPYGLLTMMVSLEGIFLSTFVLLGQNEMSKVNEERAELDLHINLLTERELTRVLQMLDTIQDKMGIEKPPEQDLAELEQETNPSEIMNEIEERENLQKNKNHSHGLKG